LKSTRTRRVAATAATVAGLFAALGLGADPADADQFNGDVDVTCTAIDVATQDIFDEVFGPESFQGVAFDAVVAAQAASELDPGEIGPVQLQLSLVLRPELVDHLQAENVPGLEVTNGAAQMPPSGDLANQNTLFGWDAGTVAVADGMDLESGLQETDFQAVAEPQTGLGQLTLESFTVFSESSDDNFPASVNVSCELDTAVVLDVVVTGAPEPGVEPEDPADPAAPDAAAGADTADPAVPVAGDPVFTG
jgi:hypothetical protein